MKKTKKIVPIFATGFAIACLLTGCGSEKEEITLCTRTLDQNGMKMDMSYKVTSKGKYVQKVHLEETVVSDNQDVLTQLEESVKEKKNTYGSIDHYDVSYTLEGNKFTDTIDTDYSKINVDDLKKVDSAIAAIFDSKNRLAKDSLIQMYESQLLMSCEVQK